MCAEYIIKDQVAKTYSDLRRILMLPDIHELPLFYISESYQDGYKKISGDCCLCPIDPRSIAHRFQTIYVFDGMHYYFGHDMIEKYAPEIVSMWCHPSLMEKFKKLIGETAKRTGYGDITLS